MALQPRMGARPSAHVEYVHLISFWFALSAPRTEQTRSLAAAAAAFARDHLISLLTRFYNDITERGRGGGCVRQQVEDQFVCVRLTTCSLFMRRAIEIRIPNFQCMRCIRKYLLCRRLNECLRACERAIMRVHGL